VAPATGVVIATQVSSVAHLKAVETQLKKIVPAKLDDPDVRSPQRRLHHVCVQHAEPSRQFALYLVDVI
jgi:hypothetical protein